MSQKVLDALKKMDPENDKQWTMDGEAKLDTVKIFSGETVTREELEKIAPGFSREAMRSYLASPEGSANGSQSNSGAGAGKPVPPIQPKQVEMEVGQQNRETEIETLAAEISRQDEAILELERIQEQSRKDLKAAHALRNTMGARMNDLVPPISNTLNIQRYLESQKMITAKRARVVNALSDAGVDLSAVVEAVNPSPIDLALKTRRR